MRLTVYNCLPNRRSQATKLSWFFALALLFSGVFCIQADAAIITVINVNGTNNGGYSIVDESGAFIADPPGLIHFGGFSTFNTASAIQTAFQSNFAALAADFISIGSVGVEVNTGIPGGPIDGLHDSTTSGLDPTAVVGRSFAVWVTTTGTINDTGAEHLIYLTSDPFVTDPVPPASEASYTARLAPGSDGGNGTLAVGGFDTTTRTDFGFGAGAEPNFNTVAVPEPSSLLFLSGLIILGIFVYRRRCAKDESSSPV